MKHKRTAFICLGFFVLAIFAFCIWKSQLFEEEESIEPILKIAIYPSGTYDETYYFELQNNNILFCAFGTRKNDEVNDIKSFKSVSTSSNKQLTEQEVQKIINIANALSKSELESVDLPITDSWNVVLYYMDKEYKIDYWINESKELRNLTNEIINFSAIPVNIHDWS